MSMNQSITQNGVVNPSPMPKNKMTSVSNVMPLVTYGKLKPDASLELRFGDSCVRSRKIIFSGARLGASVLVYKWNKKQNYWRLLDTEADPAAGALADTALSWLSNEEPEKASAKKAAECAATASMWLSMHSPLPEQDFDKTLIPCSDVYLEINKEGFIDAVEATPELGMTYSVGVACGTKAGQTHTPQPVPPDSLFGKFLAEMLPDEAVRDFVQEQCGQTLLPTCYRRAAWWYGMGKNGKSLLSDLVSRFHKCKASARLNTLSERFGLEPLIGASLIRVDEVKKGAWDEDLFKSLVSYNTESVTRKNRGNINTAIRAKWIICSNQLPFVKDGSDGVWERLEPVHWAVQVDNAVPDLGNIIFNTEASIVLDWLLEGAARQVMRGRARDRHEMPEACKLAWKKSRANSDSVRAWVDDEGVALSDVELCSKGRVYAAYSAWCEETMNAEPLKDAWFWRALQGFPDFVKMKENRATEQGKRVRMVNISLGQKG